MSQYEFPFAPPPPRRSERGRVWVILALLTGLALLLGGLVYFLWPRKDGLDSAGEPRPITPVSAPLSLEEQETIKLFETASPSVVHVTNLTERRDAYSFNIQQLPRGSGTGFVWDQDGFIVTNYHVV